MRQRWCSARELFCSGPSGGVDQRCTGSRSHERRFTRRPGAALRCLTGSRRDSRVSAHGKVMRTAYADPVLSETRDLRRPVWRTVRDLAECCGFPIVATAGSGISGARRFATHRRGRSRAPVEFDRTNPSEIHPDRRCPKSAPPSIALCPGFPDRPGHGNTGKHPGRAADERYDADNTKYPAVTVHRLRPQPAGVKSCPL